MHSILLNKASTEVQVQCWLSKPPMMEIALPCWTAMDRHWMRLCTRLLLSSLVSQLPPHLLHKSQWLQPKDTGRLHNNWGKFMCVGQSWLFFLLEGLSFSQPHPLLGQPGSGKMEQRCRYTWRDSRHLVEIHILPSFSQKPSGIALGAVG